jgi:hypothetical protein
MSSSICLLFLPGFWTITASISVASIQYYSKLNTGM